MLYILLLLRNSDWKSRKFKVIEDRTCDRPICTHGIPNLLGAIAQCHGEVSDMACEEMLYIARTYPVQRVKAGRHHRRWRFATEAPPG